MDNIKKLRLNLVFSLINQVVLIISGLVLPKFYLEVYGSEINGLQASIAQFLSIINFLELGVGAVIQSSLYKPLVTGEKKKINQIASAATRFFKTLACLLLIYVVILCIIFPNLTTHALSDTSTRFLILAMSISLFSQFYFGIVDQIILNADQKYYIQYLGSIITVILNTIISVILIYLNCSIVIVKFISGCVFLLRPIYLHFYVKNNYSIKYKDPFDKNTIPQKWNGVAQHVAYVVLESTDIIVLTIFSTLKNVSIYSIYNLVISGIHLLISSLAGGLQAFFGHMIAQNKIEELNKHFSKIEWQMHTISTLLFALTASLILPFVRIYTSGIDDANYYSPYFAVTLIIAKLIFCIRIPYTAVVLSAGHFKQTQNSAIMEALLNVVLSILLVKRFGLIGVAAGTLIAVAYRTIYFIFYLSKNILNRNIKIFLKQIAVDIISFIVMLSVGLLIKVYPENMFAWLRLAVFEGIIFLMLTTAIQFIFNRDQMIDFFSSFLKRRLS